MIFTQKQYKEKYNDGSFIRRLQQSFFSNAPWLILGSSLTDSYVVNEFEMAHKERPGWLQYCATLLPEGAERSRRGDGNKCRDEASARYTRMGLRVIWLRDYGELPSLLDAIREPAPEDPLREAETCALKGDKDGEKEQLRKLPTVPRANFQMGVALSEERKFEEAAESYQAAINSKHQEWGAKSAHNLSLLLQNNGYIDHARLLAEHALSFSDQRWAISLNVLLGDIYIKLADRDRSIIHYHNAKQLSDDVSRTTEELFVKHGAESVDARGFFAPDLDYSHLDFGRIAAQKLESIATL